MSQTNEPAEDQTALIELLDAIGKRLVASGHGADEISRLLEFRQDSLLHRIEDVIKSEAEKLPLIYYITVQGQQKRVFLMELSLEKAAFLPKEVQSRGYKVSTPDDMKVFLKQHVSAAWKPHYAAILATGILPRDSGKMDFYAVVYIVGKGLVLDTLTLKSINPAYPYLAVIP
ncbi:MAG: hypothetical protein KW793_02315 [Candidatus Doudnabacteria bacterium]|nr:hypothetical protein [Candidatus Doudnabacteria bacterium]